MNDSKALKIVKTARNIVLVNCLWLLFSIPVITIGAATCAVFYLNFKLLENEDAPLWENFIKGFKSSFVQGTVMLVFTALFGGCLFFIWSTALNSDSFIMKAGAFICSLLFIMFFIYTFPLIARYNNSFKNIFKNSAGMSFTYMWKTIIIVLLAAFFYVIFCWNFWTLVVGGVFIPGLFMYIMSRIVKTMFVQMEYHAETVKAEAEAADEEISKETSDSE